MTTTLESQPTVVLNDSQTQNAQGGNDLKSSHDELDISYKMTWRTYIAVLSLTLAWSVTTFGTSGPNSTVRFQAATFPSEAQNSSWIANAPLFSMIVLVPIFGTLSDRYGKKWFVCVGSLIGLIGSVICGSAKSLNMIIAGQAINGIAIGSVSLGIPAAMEVVPAKARTVVFGFMLTLNGCAGAIMGVFVCMYRCCIICCFIYHLVAACVQNDVGSEGEGWRWGYYVEAILFGTVMILNTFLYNPPPTELRREQTARQVLKSIDFIGLGILASGLVLLVVGIVQGGTFYPWSSARIISMLVIGPVLLIVFGIYGKMSSESDNEN